MEDKQVIVINKFPEEFVEIFNPEDKSMGLINESQMIDIQCQIAEKRLNGYYIMIGDLKCLIDEEGELSNWDDKTFDRDYQLLLRLKRIQAKSNKL